MLFINKWELTTNTWKKYNKNKESSYLKYWDVNDLYGRATSKKLPKISFKWVEETSQFNEDFIWNYIMMIVMNDNFLKLIFNILKIYIAFAMIYPFYLKEWKSKQIEKFVAYLHDEKHYVMHIRNLIEALNHGLVFTARMHRVHCCTKHEVFH